MGAGYPEDAGVQKISGTGDGHPGPETLGCGWLPKRAGGGACKREEQKDQGTAGELSGCRERF